MMKLYGYTPTRSARPKWMLQELGLKYEIVDGSKLIGTNDYKKIHPLGKIPAFEHNGTTIFESVAITNYLADMYPETGLSPRSGTIERAKYDQWNCFVLSELETWIWHSASHTFKYPKEKRIPAVKPLNREEFRKSAAVVDDVLSSQAYILGKKFSGADINLSYSLNWGKAWGYTEGLKNVDRYLAMLGERPASTLPEQYEFLVNKMKTREASDA